MKLRLFLILAMLALAGLAAFPVAVRAAEPERPQIAAATAEAIANLRANIGREELAHNLTINEFLKRTNGSDDLLKTLQRSELVGGPRWLDEQTCQVQLEINGARVGKALLVIASSNPKRSPIAPDALARVIAHWDRRTFAGTGSSTSARPVELRPAPTNTDWAGVPDDARQAALAAARADAIDRIFGSVRSIELADHQLVGDALLIPEVKKELNDWLLGRPVTRVEFRRDMQVELAISATPEETFKEFRDCLAHTKMSKRSLPSTTTEWARVRNEWVIRMALPVGRAVVAADAVHPAPARVPVPDRTPDWVGQPLVAEGSAPSERNKLLAARAAEAAARSHLLIQVNSLALSPDLSLGQAAEHNTRLREAIARLVADAPVERTLYGSMGRETTIRVELDAHDVWDAIQGN